MEASFRWLPLAKLGTREQSKRIAMKMDSDILIKKKNLCWVEGDILKKNKKAMKESSTQKNAH